MNYVVSFSFIKGGAAIAAHKFKKLMGITLHQEIMEISQDTATWSQFVKRLISFFLVKLQIDRNPVKHSLNLFSYYPVLESFDKKKAIHHIHWINNDTLSIFDFDKIPSGSIMTLHDEWLYCGAEHYYRVNDKNEDFVHGYHFFKSGTWGIPWNAIIWHIKYKKLINRNDLIYTVPSDWMLTRAKKSKILNHADIRLLPNPIDTETFLPKKKTLANTFRHKYKLDEKHFIFCFGAIGGRLNYLKGSYLLEQALEILHQQLKPAISSKVKFLMFGEKYTGINIISGFAAHSIGYIAKPTELALVYSAVDCVVIPSLVESFGQVAAEALACETPVISFACSGLMDIVIDGRTGFTAKPFCPKDFADQLHRMVMLTTEQRMCLGIEGRKHICKQFSCPVITEQYKHIVDDANQLKQNMEVN